MENHETVRETRDSRESGASGRAVTAFPSAIPVVNVHRLDPNNVGDCWSTPLRYFGFKAARVLDVGQGLGSLERDADAAAIIVGGGGLLRHRPDWDQALRKLAYDPRPTIAWGIGLGTVLRPFTARQYVAHWKRHARSIFEGDVFGSNAGEPAPSLPRYLRGYDLVGVRDDLPGEDVRWVPCASCMHPIFDEPAEVTHRIAVLEHKGVPIRLERRLPIGHRMQNTGSEIGSVLRFIASCEVLVTSTYHGAYWGTLLGKRVIVYRPFSVKFRYMRHPPTIYSGDLETDIGRSRVYPEALDEARNANIGFYRDVCEKLSLQFGSSRPA